MMLSRVCNIAVFNTSQVCDVPNIVRVYCVGCGAR